MENEVDSWEKLLKYIDDWRHSDPDTRTSVLRKIELGNGDSACTATPTTAE